MTKYILNSGGLRSSPELAKNFFIEITQGLGREPKILCCFFAVPRENWEEMFSEFENRFTSAVSSDVSPSLELALPDTFIEQVEKADAILFHGGDDHLLKYWLEKFDVPSVWKGKTVAGMSAGSNVLSTYFWTCDRRKCMDGLGIVPVKFLPHYQSNYGSNDPRGPIDWEKGVTELKKYKDTGLTVHALKEAQYVVVEI